MIAALLLIAAHPLPTPPQAAPVDLKEQSASFKKLVRGRDSENEMIAMMDGLLQRWQNNVKTIQNLEDMIEIKEGKISEHKKAIKKLEGEQKEIPAIVFSCFARRKVTEPHMRVWRAAVTALGRMGIHGPPYLWRAFEDRRFSREVDFRGRCVHQVGYTLDFKQSEELLDLLDHHQELVIAKAAEALALFGDAPGLTRKECTKQLVKKLEAYHSAATAQEADLEAQKLYRTVREPMLRALRIMTGQDFRDAQDWTRWWNKNKKNKAVWKDRE
jgi:hypothetical protein